MSETSNATSFVNVPLAWFGGSWERVLVFFMLLFIWNWVIECCLKSLRKLQIFKTCVFFISSRNIGLPCLRQLQSEIRRTLRRNWQEISCVSDFLRLLNKICIRNDLISYYDIWAYVIAIGLIQGILLIIERLPIVCSRKRPATISGLLLDNSYNICGGTFPFRFLTPDHPVLFISNLCGNTILKLFANLAIVLAYVWWFWVFLCELQWLRH